MKIVFIGNVEIGFIVLNAVYETGYGVDTVITSTLKSAKKISGFVDFAPLASENGSHLIRTDDANRPDCIKRLKKINPGLIIVCGWQKLVCTEIINIPRLGTIGFHSSLLPKYRGRAPVNWAIIKGEKETGITMFYLTSEADAGDIIAQRAFPILLNDDCHTVYLKAAQAGAELIREYLPKIEKGEVETVPNDAKNHPMYPKRNPEDGLISFDHPAIEVYNFVRALTKPYPGAYYIDRNGKKVVVWKAEIVSDESKLRDGDIVFPAKDRKIKLLEWEKHER